MNTRVKDLYHKLLLSRDVAVDMRVQVLNNLGKYLQEEEERQVRAEEQWKKHGGEENLKEMGDIQSGLVTVATIPVLISHLLRDCTLVSVLIAAWPVP